MESEELLLMQRHTFIVYSTNYDFIQALAQEKLIVNIALLLVLFGLMRPGAAT